MTSTAAPSLPGTLEVRHKQQQSQDSGAYLDWNPDDSVPGATDFVTVVTVAGDTTSPPKSQVTASTPTTPFVTVLSIGTPPQESPRRLPDGSEEVPVYRLPGERLGFGLKFEGGAADVVRRLFIQSCAPDSPASRVRCSWGSLRESDEILQIDGVPVAAMTKVQCVQRMKESKVVMRLVVRRPESPLVIGELKKNPAPPPIPPRKGRTRHENQAPPPPPPPPDGFADHRRPPEAEVYTDTLALETFSRGPDSESDDTGSSLSTVVERSVPTSTSSSGVSIDLARVLGPFEQLEREFSVPQLIPSSSAVLQPPPNFQDAPLSTVEETVKVTLPQSNTDPDDADDDEDDVSPRPVITSSPRGRGRKRPRPPPPPPPRGRPTPPPVPAPRSPSHLPRLIDFVPKESVSTSVEPSSPQPSFPNKSPPENPAPESQTAKPSEDSETPVPQRVEEVTDGDDSIVTIRLPDLVDLPDDDVDADRVDGCSFRRSCSSPLPTIGEDEEETAESDRAASSSTGAVMQEVEASTPSSDAVPTSDHNNNLLQNRRVAEDTPETSTSEHQDATTKLQRPASPELHADSDSKIPSHGDNDKGAQKRRPACVVKEAKEQTERSLSAAPSSSTSSGACTGGASERPATGKSARSMPVRWPSASPASATLSSATPTPANNGYSPCVATGMDVGTVPTPPENMPPSYSRLPPDGDEFPPRYQDSDSGVSSRPGRPASFGEVLKNSARSPSGVPPSLATRTGPMWRKDERSERSVRDKIAMFTSGATSSSPAVLAAPPTPKTPLSRATSFTTPRSRPADATGHGDEARRASLHALVEQRRKSISKLRGLVIPEARAAPTICDLPVIPCDTPPVPPPLLTAPTVPPPPQVPPPPSLLSSSPWRAPSNLPKYSPAFKRKSLTIRHSDVSPAPQRPSDIISLELPDAPKMLLSEDSDNDSAVSSSRSSISPPASPLPAAAAVPAPSDTVDSIAANDCNRRVLKAQSVDAINRKNVLFSARCRSGRDVKVGSPLIRRKFSDDEEKSGAEQVTPSSVLDTSRPTRTLRRDPREEIRELERMVSSLDADLDRDLSLSPSASDEALTPSPNRVHFRPATLRDLPSNDVKVAFLSGVDLFLESTNGSSVSTPNTTPTPTPISSPDGPAPTRQVKQRTASDPQILDRVLPSNTSSRPSLPSLGSSKTAVSVNDIRKAFEKTEVTNGKCGLMGSGVVAPPSAMNGVSAHVRMSSMDSTTSEDGSLGPLQREQYGSISSLASTTSLISQQELQQLIDEANQTLEESSSNSSVTSHELLVVILHRDSAGGSVGITLAGGADYEAKEITVHKVLAGSPAERDGRLQKGDRILSINGRNMKGVTHRESLTILKAPRPEVVLVISRSRNNKSLEDAPLNNMRISRPPRIPEQSIPVNGTSCGARGPPQIVLLTKDGAGLGFSLEGGKDSPLGDRPLTIKKVFTGGCAEKSGQLHAGDELLCVNDTDVTQMSRIEAWGLMKRLKNGCVALTVRHAAVSSS